MRECKDCKRAVRQEGEGAMCFNCHLESVPLPTAQEIEEDDYSTDQVARMLERIEELETENNTACEHVLELQSENGRLREALESIKSLDDVGYPLSDARNIAKEALEKADE